MMKIAAQICMFNEMDKGNLVRCLNNVSQWADLIVIYDDASTDDSVSVAKKYTEHIIRGEKNNQLEEQAHKQLILEKSIELGADWLMWIDCDEILDRAGTTGGFRSFVEQAKGDAYAFHEINLWRGERWARIDELFEVQPGTTKDWTGSPPRSWFTRLWRVVPGIGFETKVEVHGRLFPKNISHIQPCPIEVIHYGFSNYLQTMVKIGVDHMDKEELIRTAKLDRCWIHREVKCKCRWVPDDVFPIENIPEVEWPEPKPLPFEDMVPYSVLIEQSMKVENR